MSKDLLPPECPPTAQAAPPARPDLQQVGMRLRSLQRTFEPIGRQLVASRKPPKNKLITLFELTDRIGREMKGVGACRPGCNYCCHQALTISYEEARLIGQALGMAPTLAQKTDDALIRQQRQQYLGQPCPMLDRRGLCSVHAVRPIACRLHFNISDDATLCDNIRRPGQAVPNMDFSAIGSLYIAAMGPQAVANDIRAFFPGTCAGGADRAGPATA